jgi:CRP/FNR family transcriptional regulator
MPRRIHDTLSIVTVTSELVLSIPHLAGLPLAEAERFARELSLRQFGPREFIAVEGEPGHAFYAMVSGRGRIYRSGPDGREQILRLLGPGDTFGEVPVFDGGLQPATVEALDVAEVLVIPAGAFRLLVARYPEVASAMLQHFARRLRSFTELVEQISLQTVQQRIARYLYMTAREEGTQTAEGILVPRTITQQDLAALVGSVREVVSRTLRVMEEDGIVEIRRREILVRNLAALRGLL